MDISLIWLESHIVILFVIIVKGVVSLISFSDYLFFEFGIASSFCSFSLILATPLLYIAFTMFSYGPWIPYLSKNCIMKRFCILSNAFSASNEMIMCLFSLTCLYSGLCWWISLHWNISASLLWGLLDCCEHFDIFLNLVFKDLIKYICINVHMGNWNEVPFLCCLFVWFGYWCNIGFIDQICLFSSCFCFVE